MECIYSITCPLILITSPTAILNFPINSFCPQHSPGINLRSFNFPSILSPLPFLQPPDGTFQKLLHSAIFTVCSHTFTLFWLRKTSVIIEIYQMSFCVPFLRRSLHFSVWVFPFFFPFFVLIITRLFLFLTPLSQSISNFRSSKFYFYNYY